MKYKIEKTITFSFYSLPILVKNVLYNTKKFTNDSFIEFDSQLKKYGDTWKTALTNEKLKTWEFESIPIDNWEVEKFLINSGIDFEGIDKIMFNMNW